MTARTITFLGKSYVAAHTTDIATRAAASVEHLSGSQLVELYNLVSSNLGRGTVKRFADSAKGVKRTWGILTEWADQPEDDGQTDDLMADPEMVAYEAKASTKPVLDETDKAQVKQEAADRAPVPTNGQLVKALSEVATRGAAQTALRNNPPSSDDPAKDAEMPALRKATKLTDLKPKAKVYPRKAGSKQAVLIDLLSRPEGATFGELYDGLAATGKPWRGVTIRSGLAWDVNHIAGYGVTSELFNGEQFAAQGRVYEAHRLGMTYSGGREGEWALGEGYDPELRLAIYRLAYPAGMTEPLAHTPRKA